MKKYIYILFSILTNVLFSQNFTQSGYIYNADGSGASNVSVKLYKRTVPNITGFSSRTNYNGHSYYRSNGSKYWTDAKADCDNMGGHLATVSNTAENTFLYNTWPSGWIGYYQDKVAGYTYSEPSGGFRWTENQVTDKLVADYDVSSYSSGTTLTDITSAINSTLYNSPSYSSTGGKYLTFNGTNNYAITGNMSSKFSNSSVISVVAWVYPTGNGVIASELGVGSPSSGWHESIIEITGSNTLRVGFWNGGGITQLSTSITLNTWNMVCITYDGTTMKGYLNNVNFGSVNFARAAAHLNGNGEYFAFGLQDATNMGSGAYGNFRLGDIQFFNKCLSVDEIDRTYNLYAYRYKTNQFTYWNSGEPNNSGGEDYTQFVSSGRWNDLSNTYALQYVLEFDYIVDTTAWVLSTTTTTNAMGYYSFNVTSDPSKEYYLEVTTKTPTTTIGDLDAKKLINFVMLKTTPDGLTYHVYDLNNDNKITVSDEFMLLGKKSGLFSSWGTLPVSRLYTVTDYNSIKASTKNVRSTYSGLSTYTSTKLTSGGSTNLYIIAPGFYNSVSF